MRHAIIVTLAGRDFTVRPLTLRQLRDVGVLIAQIGELPSGAGEREARAYDQMVEILAAALGRDAPEMTGDAIYDLEITLAELRAAHRAVLRHSGLVPSGEAEAAASPGETSTAS